MKGRPDRGSRVFLSYRREDSAGHTGRLYDALKGQLGPDRVFIDIDSIRPGEDFRAVLEDALGSADSLVAVVGPRWVDAADESGQPRLHDPDDYVRLEVERALNAKARVVPVLVQGAQMPAPERLPASLSEFSSRQAVELSDNRWAYDVGRLLDSLGISKKRRRTRSRWVGVGAIALLVAAAVIGSVVALSGGGGSKPSAASLSPLPLPDTATKRVSFESYSASIPRDWVLRDGDGYNPIDSKLEGTAVRAHRLRDNWSAAMKFRLPAVWFGASATTVGRLALAGKTFEQSKSALKHYLRREDWSGDGCEFAGFTPYSGSTPHLRGFMTTWRGCGTGHADVREFAALAPNNRFFVSGQLFAPDDRFLEPETNVLRSVTIHASAIAPPTHTGEVQTPP